MDVEKARLKGELIGTVIAYVAMVRTGKLPENGVALVMAATLEQLSAIDPHTAKLYKDAMRRAESGAS